MKKSLKFGFTLAEVLIALGVVGVITAIMIPSLVTNTQSKKLAASLGRSVEAIETGCQSLIQEASELSNDGIFFGYSVIHRSITGQDCRDIPSACLGSGTNLFDNDAARFFNTRKLTNTESGNYNVHSFSGDSPSPSLNALTSQLFLNSKLGAYWGLRESGTDSMDTLDPIEGIVYVDVNGPSSPNRYGLDIFLFGLTDRCHMIPAGTNRLNGVLSTVPVENSNNGCQETNGTINVVNGLSCTHRVVRDGYKMDYDR